MPIKQASFKHERQTIKRTGKNRAEKESLKSQVKLVRKAIDAKDFAKASEELKKAIKKIDKTLQHGVIKRNAAARKKSRLTRAVNKLKS